MTNHDMPKTALVYNGTEVRAIGERLNLTDMWKAAGSQSGRGPNDWLALTSSKEFIEHVQLIAGNHGNLVATKTGRNGRTEAHWQIGLAYAKYLSPEFHMWCNTVVRERMEGKLSTAEEMADALTAKEVGGIVKAVLAKRIEPIERAVLKLGETALGVEKMLILMGNAMEEQDRRINELILASDGRVAALEYVSVRELLDEAKAVQKGRRSLNATVGHELRVRALTRIPPVPLRRCPHSMVWLFPRDFANAYMAERGIRLVMDHNVAAAGQMVLKFSRRRRSKAA